MCLLQFIQPSTIYRKYSYGFHFVTLSSKNYLKISCVLLPSITTLHLRTQEQVALAGFVDPPSLVLHPASYFCWIANTKLGVEFTFNGIMFTQNFLKFGQHFQELIWQIIPRIKTFSHSVTHMRASVQTGAYLEFVFLLYSVVNLRVSVGVREAGDKLDNWTTTGEQVA
jgi:hypothetical protein